MKIQIKAAVVYATKLALVATIFFPLKFVATGYFFHQDIALREISILAIRDFSIFFPIGLFCYIVETKFLEEQKQRTSPEKRRTETEECYRKLQEISDGLRKGKGKAASFEVKQSLPNFNSSQTPAPTARRR
jgi:hypothetical protein